MLRALLGRPPEFFERLLPNVSQAVLRINKMVTGIEVSIQSTEVYFQLAICPLKDLVVEELNRLLERQIVSGERSNQSPLRRQAIVMGRSVRNNRNIEPDWHLHCMKEPTRRDQSWDQ
jgi:hypothetical protein